MQHKVEPISLPQLARAFSSCFIKFNQSPLGIVMPSAGKFVTTAFYDVSSLKEIIRLPQLAPGFSSCLIPIDAHLPDRYAGFRMRADLPNRYVRRDL